MVKLEVSVIIPTFNRAHLIKQAVESVLKQTVSPLEIIIVDDFSTDDTKKIIQTIKDTKVRYTLNTYSKGANGARNTGIMLAKGNYIAFQDSDDIWLPTKLQKQLECMKANTSIDMCFSSLRYVNDEESRLFPKKKIDTNKIYHQLNKGNFISTQTIILKKEVAQKYLFDEKLRRFQDWDFCLRIAKAHKIFHLDEALVNVEIQNDSITKREDGLKAINQLFKKHPDIVNASFNNKLIYKKIMSYNRFEQKRYFTSVLYYMNYLIFKIMEKTIKREDKL